MTNEIQYHQDLIAQHEDRIREMQAENARKDRPGYLIAMNEAMIQDTRRQINKHRRAVTKLKKTA